MERKCSGCSSSGGGGPVDVAVEGGRVVDDRQLLSSRSGGLTRPKRVATAEVHENKYNSDQSNDEEGEERGPYNGGGGGGGGEVVMEEVGKLLVGNGIVRGEAELGEVSLDFFELAVNVGDGVKEVGREEGGDEVPIINKGDGGDDVGTVRSYGAVLKFNRTKRGKFKESYIIQFYWKV